MYGRNNCGVLVSFWQHSHTSGRLPVQVLATPSRAWDLGAFQATAHWPPARGGPAPIRATTVQLQKQPHSTSGTKTVTGFRLRLCTSALEDFVALLEPLVVFALESESLSATAAYVAELGVISRLRTLHGMSNPPSEYVTPPQAP